jgi:predicted  nucleic acid-binding Zn-ribbon protein
MAMFRWMKGILGGGRESHPREITFPEVPSVLDSREVGARKELNEQFASSRERIQAIAERILEQVKEMAATEREADSHPKLEKITSSSLPQFEKAITTALARPLPDDAEAFYQAGTEALKGLVKGLAGPGRYLRTTFPEEMKAIRILVDKLGREMNHLTPPMAEWRKGKEQVEEIRKLHHRVQGLAGVVHAAREEIPGLRSSLEAARRSFSDTGRQLEEAGGSAEERDSYDKLVRERDRRREEYIEQEREARVVASTLAHLFRKAGKLTYRGDSPGLSRQLHRAADLFSGEELPAAAAVSEHLASAVPVVASMVASGEIPLKNQEEKRLFADPAGIAGTVITQLTRRETLLLALRETGDHLARHPLNVRRAALEQEQSRLAGLIREKEERERDLESRARDAEAELPALREALEEKLGSLLGTEVKVSGTGMAGYTEPVEENSH